MKKKTKIIIGILVVVVLSALIIARFIGKEESYAEVSPPQINTSSPEMGNIELSSSLIGKVEPLEVVYVSPEISGEVTSVMIKAGDRVTAGQALCRIDNTQVDATRISMDSAGVSLADARASLERAEALYAEGAISSQSYEDTQSAFKRAQLQYETTQLAYSNQSAYSTITSPIAGTVELCDVEAYDTVSPQTVLCVISGGEEKVISFDVTERIVTQLKLGDQVEIEKNGSEYIGTISEVSSMVDSTTGLFKIKASIQHGEALATGSSAKLYVTSDKVENVLIIPVDAVYYDNEKAFVYTYEEGSAHKTTVEVGLCDENKIEVLSGLDTKDKVIDSWSSELYDNATVTLAKKASDTKDKSEEE
jgi:RND family efflux transporter MFP subunit